jgi:hypothetical protein
MPLPWATEPAGDPLVFLLNFGTLGVVFVLLLTGLLYTKSHVQHLEKELEDKNRVIETLSSAITTHTIPALAQTARVMEAVPSSEAALVEEIRQLRNRVETLVSREDTP